MNLHSAHPCQQSSGIIVVRPNIDHTLVLCYCMKHLFSEVFRMPQAIFFDEMALIDVFCREALLYSCYAHMVHCFNT